MKNGDIIQIDTNYCVKYSETQLVYSNCNEFFHVGIYRNHMEIYRQWAVVEAMYPLIRIKYESKNR